MAALEFAEGDAIAGLVRWRRAFGKVQKQIPPLRYGMEIQKIKRNGNQAEWKYEGRACLDCVGAKGSKLRLDAI